MRLVVVESAAHRLTRVALPEAAQRVDGPAHRTQRPPTPLPAGEVALEVTFVPPTGQKLDLRWGDPTRLDVSATPDALLVSGSRSRRGPDADARPARRHRVGHAAHLGAGSRVRRRPRDRRGARARRVPPLPAGLGDPGHPRPDRRCHTDSRPSRGPGRKLAGSTRPAGRDETSGRQGGTRGTTGIWWQRTFRPLGGVRAAGHRAAARVARRLLGVGHADAHRRLRRGAAAGRRPSPRSRRPSPTASSRASSVRSSSSRRSRRRSRRRSGRRPPRSSRALR